MIITIMNVVILAIILVIMIMMMVMFFNINVNVIVIIFLKIKRLSCRCEEARRRLKHDIMEKKRALDIDQDCLELGELSVRIHNHAGE